MYPSSTNFFFFPTNNPLKFHNAFDMLFHSDVTQFIYKTHPQNVLLSNNIQL
jgi:hypothetical protein